MRKLTIHNIDRMKKILLVLIIGIPTMSGAQVGEIEQNKFFDNIGGTFVKATKAYNIAGSPFFPSTYCNATIKVLNGKKYENVFAKIDLESNEVYVKFADSIELISSLPLEYVEFKGGNDGKKLSFRSGFPPVDRKTETAYYQVFSEGDITLLKNFNTTYRDLAPFATSTVTRTFESSPLYYAYLPAKGMMVRLKDNTAVLQLLPAQKSQVEKFMNDENIKIKKENDLVKLFAFLNTLSARKN